MSAPVDPVEPAAVESEGAPAAVGVPTAVDAVAERLDDTLGERLSDRLNPILVREIQQATNGRLFVGALMLALVGIVLVALSAAVAGGASRQDGWTLFTLAMQVLAPILLLIVPLQAFMSMRQEVAAGTVEHLLLSRLTPLRVVRGKIAAAAVQSLVFFSVFAPLIALSYLLRGVDVPTIAVALGFAFLYAIGAATLGVALGSLSRWPAFRVLPLLVATVVLTLGTAMVTGAMPYVLVGVALALRSLPDRWVTLGAFAVLPLYATALCGLVASAALSHPHENRSTPFRAFATLTVAGVVAWAGWTATRSLGGFFTASSWAAGAASLLALVLFPFWMFAATENDRLSPRVRTLVPRHALLAALSLPFLPGGMRGVVWTYMLGILATAFAWFVPGWFGQPSVPEEMHVLLVSWSYVGLYATLARWVRSALRRTGRGPALARLLFPFLVGVLSVVPALIDVMAFGRSGSWWPIHVLNPFSTVEHVESGRNPEVVLFLAVLASVGLLLQARPIAQSVREVLDASRARRRRASA